MAKVFISYARKDIEEVYPIVDLLEKNGIDCWIDFTGIESGEEFKKVIIAAINECSEFLYMLSDNAVDSEWVGKEFGHAKRKGKRIIPVLLKGATQNDEIMFDWDQIDYVDTENEGWQEKLLRAVKKQCGIGEDKSKVTSEIPYEKEHATSTSNAKEDLHEFVDLGLPSGLLWATCNIGASKLEEVGDYFAWGETVTKDWYDSKTAKSCGDEFNLIKSNIINDKGVLTKEFDAATKNIGNNWRMPTNIEFDELIDNCNWVLCSLNETYGYKVSSTTNHNWIFLPFTGFVASNVLKDEKYAYYWSSFVRKDKTIKSYNLFLSSQTKEVQSSYRYNGFPIRPVMSKK
ncbi:MAG: toll/interleukin-1 receptor domain-containing protein [Paludibacteraceae bacterium]|nr:toll/interleukin-1 receptor domain-containing protein [Paludibacteraceae bacterium]